MTVIGTGKWGKRPVCLCRTLWVTSLYPGPLVSTSVSLRHLNRHFCSAEVFVLPLTPCVALFQADSMQLLWPHETFGFSSSNFNDLWAQTQVYICNVGQSISDIDKPIHECNCGLERPGKGGRGKTSRISRLFPLSRLSLGFFFLSEIKLMSSLECTYRWDTLNPNTEKQK